jgi:hypothetical protein
VKRLAAAALGLALSVSLFPVAQAQSLNFGSLVDAPDETASPHWTEGIGFTIRAYSDSEDVCWVEFALDESSASDIPAGSLNWVDGGTERDWIVPPSTDGTRRMGLVGFLPSGQAHNSDLVGTYRQMDFYIVDPAVIDSNYWHSRTFIGAHWFNFPSSCPLGPENEPVLLDSGTIKP